MNRLTALIPAGAAALVLALSACDAGSTAPDQTETTSASVTITATEKATPQAPAQGKQALAKAKTYANTMHMSKKGVYEQLTSEFDRFPTEAAQYAVDNVGADWKANAAAKAKTYHDSMNMSVEAVREQLVSQFDGFTPAEADYAVAQLGA